MCVDWSFLCSLLSDLSLFTFTDRPELFADAPVGLQLMGRPQEEEAVIAMTEIVDDALKSYKSKC